jgi:hypothetical protein
VNSDGNKIFTKGWKIMKMLFTQWYVDKVEKEDYLDHIQTILLVFKKLTFI